MSILRGIMTEKRKRGRPTEYSKTENPVYDTHLRIVYQREMMALRDYYGLSYSDLVNRLIKEEYRRVDQRERYSKDKIARGED